MRYLLILSALVFNSHFASAQVAGPENMAVYCSGDYLVTADSKFYALNPGEVKELRVDLRGICSLYLNADTSLQIGVSFSNDPYWRKGKDQIAVQGLIFEVIDAVTGQNLVDLAKSLDAPACNWGSGFVFSDLTTMPMTLRPVILRLKNVGRRSVSAAYTLHYSNTPLTSQCSDYPRTR
ncbi:hypothetical protein [Bdellovibrio sp. HCB337]|uniref:hypothetical protein n=1 Tax=Bdellovibrio sp. HCB337 TaxID=3394358 RepID=UPI0039A43AAC